MVLHVNKKGIRVLGIAESFKRGEEDAERLFEELSGEGQVRLAEVKPFVVDPKCDVQRPQWWRQAPKELPAFGEEPCSA